MTENDRSDIPDRYVLHNALPCFNHLYLSYQEQEKTLLRLKNRLECRLARLFLCRYILLLYRWNDIVNLKMTEMIHAYNELYLNDAELLLANAFDYAINDCKEDPDDFGYKFSNSNIVKNIETGNPAIISGKSGVELIQDFFVEIYRNKVFPKPRFPNVRTQEYWAGWSLAYYQWYSGKRFKDILGKIPLSEIISMYNPFHEMDISSFVEEIENRYSQRKGKSNLKKIREARGISQSQLSKISGVKLRSIQLYEQKVNDIDKAQAQALYKLARVLGCQIEDLLEEPERGK